MSTLKYAIVIIVQGIIGSIIIIIEHYYAFMAKTVDPNTDALGDNDNSVHSSREAVQSPGTNKKIFTMNMEEELYNEKNEIARIYEN